MVENGATKLSADFSEKYVELLKSALCASLYDESAWRVMEGPLQQDIASYTLPRKLSAKAKHAVLAFLRRRNLRLVRAFPFDQASRDMGTDWPMFGFTMTGRRRLDALQRCIDDLLEDDIPGDFIETGVWRGGSVIFMRALLSARNDRKRTVWCADSFEGMPVPRKPDIAIPTDDDLSDMDYLNVSIEQVQRNFARFGLLDDRVKFLKGWFRDSLPTAPIQKLSLLRLDGDLYESTRDALVNLYHKVSPGGYVIVDDYNSWGGCHVAIDEFRKQHSISDPIEEIDTHAILWRVQPA